MRRHRHSLIHIFGNEVATMNFLVRYSGLQKTRSFRARSDYNENN